MTVIELSIFTGSISTLTSVSTAYLMWKAHCDRENKRVRKEAAEAALQDERSRVNSSRITELERLQRSGR